MIDFYVIVLCFVLYYSYQLIVITSCHNSGIWQSYQSMDLAAIIELDSNHFLPDSPPPFYTVAETLISCAACISCVAKTHSRECLRSVDKHMLV